MFSACDAQVGLGVALGRSGSNSAGLRALKEYRRVHADDVNEDAVVAHMEMGAIIFKQVSLEALQTYCSCMLTKPPLNTHTQGNFVEAASHFRGVLHLLDILLQKAGYVAPATLSTPPKLSEFTDSPQIRKCRATSGGMITLLTQPFCSEAPKGAARRSLQPRLLHAVHRGAG